MYNRSINQLIEVATQLNVGDTLYVKAYKDNMYIHGGWSSMTVIKLRQYIQIHCICLTLLHENPLVKTS